MKAFKRILSLSLVAVMMFVYYIASPAKTLADEIEEQRAIEAYAETNSFSGSQELPYSPLVGEDAAGRAESIRVFLREDGAREAVVYAEPVNYLMNGAWQPIDNTLTLVTLEDGTQVYRNTASDFIVSFAPLFSSNRLVTVETGGQSLSWRFVGAETDSLPEPTPEPTPEPMITTEPIILPPEADQSIESEPETETAVTPENDQMVDTETSEPSDAQSETDAQPADPAVDSELPGTEEPTLELEIIEPEAETAPTATPAPEAESNPTEPAASEEQLPAEDELTEAAFDLSAFDTLAITDAVAQIVTNTETFSAESAEAVAALTDEERDMQLRFPSSLQSEIAYVDPATGLNVRYVLSGKTLREYITLASAPERAVAYSVEIQAMGVSPVTDEAGATAFVNASGQPVFTLGQAIMYDAAGEQSSAIEAHLSEFNADTGTCTYTLIPDTEWLQSADRQYPLSIDPDVSINFSSAVQDTFVNSGSGNGNYSSYQYMRVSKSHEALIYIPNANLPTLSSGDVILKATLNLNRYNSNTNKENKEINLSAITGTWNHTTVTWNTKPAHNSAVDSFGVSTVPGQYTSFDITKIVKNWYETPSSNRGVALYNTGSYSDLSSSEYTANANRKPYYSVIYRNSTGLEDTWAYYSQSIGRAGTGSVNAFSGNLTMTHADASVSNGVLPISLSHVYNTNDRTANIGYGYGWRLNYAQSLKKVSVTNLSGTATYYQYIDGDGTRHYYKADGTSTTQYVNELDKDSVLTISGTTVTITDKGDNKLIFECDSSVANGRLTTIRDANGNETNIAYTTTTITNLRISSITEKLAGNDAGQALTLAYTNDLLSQVTAPNGLNVSYAYSDTNLTGITYADGETVSYTYNGNRCLTKATNIDAYSISYSYTAGAPYRVTRAAEAAGSTNGQYLTFTYGRNKTTVADAQGRRTVYHTDNIGQPVSVTDPEGRAVFATYNTASQTVTQLKAVSKMQMTVVNLLKNHGFEESTWPSSWTRSDSGNLTNDSSRRHTGAYSCKITAGSAARTLSQSVSVTSGQTYTLSAYFSGTLNTAYLKVTNGSSTIQSPAVTAGGTGWNRESLTFTAASSTITVAVIVPAGSGTVYVDSIQLEKGAAPNRYNMVMNSDFTSGTSNYTMNYANYCAIVDVADAKYAAARDTHPSFLDSKVYEMNGTSKAEKIKQTFLSGSTGDTYTFGAWIASNNIPQTKQQIYTSSGSTTTKDYGIKRLVLQFLNSSGTVVCSGYVNFAADTDEWQFASGTVTATSSYAQMQIVVEYTDSLNVLYVDGLQLHKEQFATGYSYDSNGNLSGTVSLIGQQNSFGYDSNDNLTSMTDARGNTTTYTYDSKHNLLTSTSPEGVVTSNTYNDFGLATETKVGTEADYIRTTTTYDSASGIAINETDASGNTVTYTLDPVSRTRTAITDARNNTTTYTYGSPANYGRLQTITTEGLNPITYSYTTNGEIQSISRGGTSYNYSYDVWGRSLGLAVGEFSLSTNVFNSAGLLSEVEYGNGFAVKYSYDNLDRLIAVQQKLPGSTSYATAYEYVYNGDGELYEERNYLNNRALFREYDHSGRCIASIEKTFTGSSNSLTYGTVVSTYLYHYDANNNISRIQQSVAGSSWSMVYTYDKDNHGLTTTLENGVVLTNSYDAIGRVQSKQIGLSTPYSINVSYKNGVNGSSSILLDTYRNGTDDAYSYTYDANNNILSVAQGSTASSYVYDAANQLVRANIYNSSTDSYTAIYAYDGNGNLTSKTLYPYTTDELGTATSTIQYGYATEGWSDQLTSYNGQSIVYDTSGNPTVYLGQSLSWNGLQLTGVGSNISYAYDKDGIRQTKTIDTATTQYYYNGNVLMGTYDGINKLLFSYDDQSNVVAVDYNGTYYYYLRDGQGSIVKLIDGNGSTVVSYSYDPWGVCTTTGSMASTLGALNPFRYHGYVYDEETGWYYLLSRYYNPTVGRYLSADTLSSTGQGVLGYNMYAYCLNNPTTNYDPSGSLSFSNIFSGASLLSIGLAAVAIGATILTCGAAAPIMVAVAAATTTTGIVTVANGIAEVQEGLTATNDTSNDGQNFMRDAFFRGDKAAYEKQRDVIATVAEVGTFLCTAYIGIKGGVCFVAGTAVLTAAGQVPIESISEGDLVYASDPETGESGYKRVVQTFVNETDELVHLQYGGTTVTTTPTHPFYQPQKGWIDAIDLRAGDILVKSNGEYVVVEAVEHELLEEPITVYNFEVEGLHTYYVGDTSVLVHNDCTKPRSPRKVGEDLIKRNDFDAHSFKRQNGARGPVAHWDIFQDTADKGRIWLGDKAQKVWIITKHHFSDLFKWF